MPKYRKKPVVIEAFKFPCMEMNDLYELAKTPEWFKKAIENETVRICPEPESDWLMGIIKTLEGDMNVRVDEYVIQGVKGELYPCKPDIFEATYESVDES